MMFAEGVALLIGSCSSRGGGVQRRITKLANLIIFFIVGVIICAHVHVVINSFLNCGNIAAAK
jgi:hypothetical protein